MSTTAAAGIPEGKLQFALEQLRAMPWRILLNFFLGAILVFGLPPLKWAQKLFEPDYRGIENGALWNDMVSYVATFENQSLLVVLVAIALYALFASTVVFAIKGLLLDWYTDVLELDEVRSGLRSLLRFPLRIGQHFLLWLSIALTWIALGVCYKAIAPNQVFGFNELWAHYAGVWKMLSTGARLDWQLSVLLFAAVPSAITDLYLKRRFVKRIRALIAGRTANNA